MDSNRYNENITFLTECVSDEMTALEAASATKACWSEAETAMAPVIGPEGVGVLLRTGEEVAVRKVGADRLPVAGMSIGSFCDWIGSLGTRDAVAACKAFLGSVERYLVSLIGVDRARRLLARNR